MKSLQKAYHITIKHRRTLLTSLCILGVIWLIRPMETPFHVGYSTTVFDCNGHLLRATLAPDQQIRFPVTDAPLPHKYITCIKTYEDKRFGRHPGVDALGLVRAVVANLKGSPFLQGGSTLPMQVGRMAAPKKRNIPNKIREAAFALRLALHFTSDEILSLYAAHVPMGGNTVGLHAAAFRYFSKPPEALTWAEAALFAVLPNAPTDINLERRRPVLRDKRNRLLQRLAYCGEIDSLTAALATLEPLPKGGGVLPFKAPHLCQHVMETATPGASIHLTVDDAIQQQTEAATAQHHLWLSRQSIYNVAVLVAETRTGAVRAYVGSQSFQDTLHQGQVNGITARRSTGSLLKPYLVAKVLDRGPYTLQSQILDVPTFYGNFMPQNASKRHAGLVSLESVLIRSLNVPAARLLNRYGLEDFYADLKTAGFTGLFRPAAEYGLPLILGGAEASLFELITLYLSLGNQGRQIRPRLKAGATPPPETQPLFSPGAAWLVLGSLNRLSRPGAEAFWRRFSRQIPVAWKTGTSYGQKDGWAIGVNAQWTIGVWVGNFTGEGNAAVSGARAAGPLLFALFNRLTDMGSPLWFVTPEAHLSTVEICAQSGFPAGSHCPETTLAQRPVSSWRAGVCPYHKRYLIDDKTGRSTCSLCWNEGETHWETRFIVPASARGLLTARGHTVDIIPRHKAACSRGQDRNRFDLIYPTAGIKIVIPRDYDGQYEKIVLAAKHQQAGMHCFWYLNNHFVGETVNAHETSLSLDPGPYTLTVEDEEGFSRTVQFSVFKK